MKITTLKKCYLAFSTLILMNSGLFAEQVHPAMDECESETAFAFLNNDDDPLTADAGSTCFIPQFNRWGWTTLLDFSTETGQPYYEMDIYSGAGQCDLSKGTDVGTVNITHNDDSTITVNYSLDGFVLTEAHIYIGEDPYPIGNSGEETVAPGQYTYVNSDVGDLEDYSVTIPVEGTAFYVIVHGVSKGADCPDDDCPDSDGDGVCDDDDICPGFDDSADSDGDGIPDGCDDGDCPDTDEDGVCDDDDICPGFDDSVDTDGDGIPDGCDTDDCPDSDGDGVCDDDDICPIGDDNIDNNGNGIPDACEGIGEINPVDIDVYPVPFNDKINIRYEFNYDTKVKIELFDMKGVQLMDVENINYIKGTIGNTRLNLSKVSNQLLVVRLTTSQGMFTKKIISK